VRTAGVFRGRGAMAVKTEGEPAPVAEGKVPIRGVRTPGEAAYTPARSAPEVGMATLAEVCGSAVAFTYRSIDRLILNAYIPTLQTPGAVAWFLREVVGKPILSPVVFTSRSPGAGWGGCPTP
jgi:hypothetical protein